MAKKEQLMNTELNRFYIIYINNLLDVDKLVFFLHFPINQGSPIMSKKKRKLMNAEVNRFYIIYINNLLDADS